MPQIYCIELSEKFGDGVQNFCNIIRSRSIQKGTKTLKKRIPWVKSKTRIYPNQAFGVMHGNALVMQYRYFFRNISIFHYYFSIMIYCIIASYYFRKCIIPFCTIFFSDFLKSI